MLVLGDSVAVAPELIQLLIESGGSIRSASGLPDLLGALRTGRADLVVVDLTTERSGTQDLAVAVRGEQWNRHSVQVVGLLPQAASPSPQSPFSALWAAQDFDRNLARIVYSFGYVYENALTNAGEDPELLRELVVIFLEECPRILADLRNGVAADDCQKVEMAAHKLKGSVASFGAAGAVRLAFEMEEAARAKDVSRIREGLMGIELVTLQLSRALSTLISQAE